MMLSALSNWLGLSLSNKQSIREELNIIDAVDSHIKWKSRLLNYLNGTSDEKLDPMVICRDDQCKLGKWIHGPGLNHFHEHAQFHLLRADHAQFHFIAGKIIQKAQENDMVGANALMQGEYAQTSHKVVHSLTELNKAVTS